MADTWITTKGGDKGYTSLGNGTRVPKDSPRVALYGTLDECQAHVGMARATCTFPEVCSNLCTIEQELGVLMGHLALFPGLDIPDIKVLEKIVEKVRTVTGSTFRFIRPGDSIPGAALHAARTVSRRAERLAVGMYREGEIDDACFAYINRLSDAIYAIALWIDFLSRDTVKTNCE